MYYSQEYTWLTGEGVSIDASIGVSLTMASLGEIIDESSN